ncbi:MAG: dethiobiotin synthase [Muribaculaceae bacterium]|nr:dethiobiotin synthase [Muribaculaceae bacterium]
MANIFISGIGTDVGKSWATAWLATYLAQKGQRVITQKFIQTGNTGLSEDIMLHRRLTGMPLTQFDHDRVTCPVIFTYPASPHLAAEIDRREIDLQVIDNATATLSDHFDTVLIEGAGGLMVPVTRDFLTIDYIASRRLPLAFVTHGGLGSISDTLLAFNAIRDYGIELKYVVYNPHFDSDRIIADDAREYMRAQTTRLFPDAEFLVMPDDFAK